MFRKASNWDRFKADRVSWWRLSVTKTFPDVQKRHIFYAHIIFLANHQFAVDGETVNVVKGFGDGTYKPDQT